MESETEAVMNKREKDKNEIPPDPVLVRRGRRVGAGADTPSGPRTDRTTTAAKKEQAVREGKEPEPKRGLDDA
jgi:hypothetical protein